MPSADQARQRAIVDAFLTACRGGDVQALVTLLDPDVVLRAAGVAVRGPAPARRHRSGRCRRAVHPAGARSATGRHRRRARPGLGPRGGGTPLVGFDFTVVDGKILEIELMADPGRLGDLDIAITPGTGPDAE